MDLNEYQKKALETAIYPQSTARSYTTLGLASEAGEVAGIWKKCLRDRNGVPDKQDIEKITKELGDVLWYCATVAKEFGLDLSSVAEENVKKLASRKERGVLRGSGDDR